MGQELFSLFFFFKNVILKLQLHLMGKNTWSVANQVGVTINDQDAMAKLPPKYENITFREVILRRIRVSISVVTHNIDFDEQSGISDNKIGDAYLF